MADELRNVAFEIVMNAHYSGDHSCYWPPADDEPVEITGNALKTLFDMLSGERPLDMETLADEIKGAYNFIHR